MLKHTIDRLLSEQDPAKLADNPLVKATKERYAELRDAPFVELQLLLKGGSQMAGVLTAWPQGPLMLVSVGQTPDRKVMLVESYFSDSELQAIVVGREMPEQLIKPVNPRGPNGSPIIVGGH